MMNVDALACLGLTMAITIAAACLIVVSTWSFLEMTGWVISCFECARQGSIDRRWASHAGGTWLAVE
jgi:hypothetical protein